MACPIKVETLIKAPDFAVEIDAQGYTLESYKQIDHDNSSDRKWLGSHCFWALRNGRIVITTPLA